MSKLMNVNARRSIRESISPIPISGFTSVDHMTLITRYGEIVDASHNGFLIRISREDLVSKILKSSLTLTELIGDRVFLTISQMHLEISGQVVRVQRINKTQFDIGIDFSEDAADYWRECLFEFLPREES